MLMSMESSQSKNEQEERERGGDEKLPPPLSKKKGKKGCVLGVYRACDVCELCLPGTATLQSVE